MGWKILILKKKKSKKRISWKKATLYMLIRLVLFKVSSFSVLKVKPDLWLVLYFPQTL